MALPRCPACHTLEVQERGRRSFHVGAGLSPRFTPREGGQVQNAKTATRWPLTGQSQGHVRGGNRVACGGL